MTQTTKAFEKERADGVEKFRHRDDDGCAAAMNDFVTAVAQAQAKLVLADGSLGHFAEAMREKAATLPAGSERKSALAKATEAETAAEMGR